MQICKHLNRKRSSNQRTLRLDVQQENVVFTTLCACQRSIGDNSSATSATQVDDTDRLAYIPNVHDEFHVVLICELQAFDSF